MAGRPADVIFEPLLGLSWCHCPRARSSPSDCRRSGGFLVQFKEGVATGVLRRCKKILSFLAWGFEELRWCLELSGTLGKLGYFDQSIHAAISLKRY